MLRVGAGALTMLARGILTAWEAGLLAACFPSTTSGRSQETRQTGQTRACTQSDCPQAVPALPPPNPQNLMEEAPLRALSPSPLKASPPARASRRSIGRALDPYSRVNCSGCRGSFFPEL